jgi:hypothetical protein
MAAGTVKPCEPPTGEVGVGLCYLTALSEIPALAKANVRRVLRHCDAAACPCPHHEYLVGPLDGFGRYQVARSVGLA